MRDGAMALSRAGLLDTATPPLENMSRTENLSIEFKVLGDQFAGILFDHSVA